MAYTDNPFTPNFGQVPAHMAGRRTIVNDILRALDRGSGDPNLTSILVGPRGSGKTALLTYFANEAQGRGWIAANVSAEPGMLEDILERTQEAARHLISPPPTSHLKSVSIGGAVGIEWDASQEGEGNWRTRMNRLLDELSESGTGLLITVDEVTADESEMVQLASVYQHFVREGRKVALIMAGLPGAVSSLLNHKSISFLRRSSQHQLGAIGAAEVRDSLEMSFQDAGRSITSDALDAAVQAIGGFPYMLQLVGYRAWDRNIDSETVTGEDVRVAVGIAKDDLASRVFDATYFELSDGDLRFLEAMLPDERESRTATIAKRLGESSSFASVYKKRLLALGVIGEVRRGVVYFELPGFREYLEGKM